MSSRKMAMVCMALMGAAALWGTESLAGGRRTTEGVHGSQARGCRDLVALKHPDAKATARKKEWDKCMADPDGYNN